MAAIPTGYTHRWLPLESNPDVFTSLAHTLGLSTSMIFQDVFSLDPDALSFLPRPVYALVLVFPTGDKYEETVAASEAVTAKTDVEDIMWFKQTIHNACGFYGLLHALCNGDARKSLLPNSLLSNIVARYPTTSPTEQPSLLASPELEREYHTVATKGDSIVPALEDEVDFHYTCFVKSDGRLWELNGDLDGPVDKGALGEDDDIVSDTAVGHVRQFMQANGGDGIGFSMLALTSDPDALDANSGP